LLDLRTSACTWISPTSFAHESFQVGIDVYEGMSMQPGGAALRPAALFVQLAQYDKAEADLRRPTRLDPHQSLSTAAQGLAAV
jgi:hypothetical protein